MLCLYLVDVLVSSHHTHHIQGDMFNIKDMTVLHSNVKKCLGPATCLTSNGPLADEDCQVLFLLTNATSIRLFFALLCSMRWTAIPYSDDLHALRTDHLHELYS